MAAVEEEGDLVVVAPAGSGKSLLFQLHAALPGEGTVIVIVPLLALLYDQFARCKALGLDVQIWPFESRNSAPSLILASVGEVAKPDFRQMLCSPSVKRIYLDEAHLLVTSDFRLVMGKATGELRKTKAPLCFLSGSLPPVLLTKLEEVFKLRRYRVIREEGVLRNLGYEGVLCEGKEEMLRKLKEIVKERREKGESGVIYTLSKPEAEMLGQELRCPSIHSESEVRAQTVKDWVEGSIPLLVATNGIGTGTHPVRLDFTVHWEGSYSPVDFYQETARAGRDGRLATSYFLTSRQSKREWFGKMKKKEQEDWKEWEEIWNIMTDETGGCLREKLGEKVDGKRWKACWEGGMEKCHVCEAKLSKFSI